MRKPGPPRDVPPPLELECLKVLWSLGEATVRQVREGLLPNRVLAYTTVMTVLDRLAQKGTVERKKTGRLFVYAPLVTRDTLRRAAVKDLVDSLFGGSDEELLAYLRNRGLRPAVETSPGPPDSEALDTALL